LSGNRSSAAHQRISTTGLNPEHSSVAYWNPIARFPLTQLYRDAYIYVMAEDSDILGEALAALASLAVRRTSRQLSLTATSTLATLERTGPRRLTDLAVNEGVTQPSMTAIVTQLQDLSFAERRRDPADRRVVLVAITSAGGQHLRTMRRAGASVFRALIDKLTGPERAALSSALPALRQLVELAAESPDSQPRSANAQAMSSSRSGRAPRTGPDRRIR
jgi:DNA-binding MarR family transcriptional regulator